MNVSQFWSQSTENEKQEKKKIILNFHEEVNKIIDDLFVQKGKEIADLYTTPEAIEKFKKETKLEMQVFMAQKLKEKITNACIKEQNDEKDEHFSSSKKMLG